MRVPHSRRRAALASLTGWAAALSLVPAVAGATGVAYMDGNEVWASNAAGTAKVRLSGGQGDWQEVAQSDQGYVVGIERVPGKANELSTFTIWDPTGTQVHHGPLAGLKPNGGLSAYPLSLDITPDGGLLVYGFSNYVYGFPLGTLTTGHLLLPSTTQVTPALGAYANTSAMWPTLVGERVVGTPDEQMASVQDASNIASTTFVPWINTAGEPGAPELHRTDVAATGTVAALEYAYYAPSGTTPTDQKVLMIRTASLGGATIDAGQCMLPATGQATQPSLSQDAKQVAWADAGGVKLGGVPDFAGPSGGTCALTAPAVTISATGKYPSLGPIDVDAILAAHAGPVPGGGGAGTGTTGTGSTGSTGGSPSSGAPSGGAGASSTPAVATTAASTGSTTAGVTTARAPVISPVVRLKLSGLAGTAGVSVTATSPIDGTATASLSVSPKALGKKGTKPIVIASGSAKLTAGKAGKLTLKAAKSQKRALKKLKSKKATLTVTTAGGTTTTMVTLT